MSDTGETLPVLPKGWTWTTLGEISTIASGGTPSTSKPENFGGDISWITPADLSDFDGKYISKGTRNITEKGLNSSAAVLLPKGTVIFSSRAPIGYVAIAQNYFCTNQGCKNFIPLEGIFSDYLFYYLKGNKALAEKYASGTTFLELSASRAAKLPFPLAPFPEQQRIVIKIDELFTKLDAGEAALHTIQSQLKVYRQSVLKAAMTGKLTEQWKAEHKDEIEPALVLLEKIKEERKKKLGKKYKELPPVDTSKLSVLPENWTWTRVGEISEIIQYGTSEKAKADSTGILVIRMGNIQDGKLVFHSLKYFPEDWSQLNCFLLEDGDVLFNRTNSAELVGKTAVYKNYHPRAVFASYLIRIKTFKEFYHPNILSFFINSSFGRKYIASVVSQQVGQANVNGTKLSMMSIPLIPVYEQNKIMDAIERSFSMADEMEKTTEKSIQQAKRLRQSILKRAFEGKLVPQDPTDEPASKLLERIKAEKEKLKQTGKKRPNGEGKQQRLISYVK